MTSRDRAGVSAGGKFLLRVCPGRVGKAVAGRLRAGIQCKHRLGNEAVDDGQDRIVVFRDGGNRPRGVQRRAADENREPAENRTFRFG